MNIKKIDMNEIVDDNNGLIGSDDTPKSGSDLESQSNNTTDYNTKISRQPFRYDMLGRFGFTLLPFFEGEEDSIGGEINNDLNVLLNELYIEIISYYFRNPNKIKPDYRKLVKDKSSCDKMDSVSSEYTNKIIGIIKPHIEKSLKTLDENIKNGLDESIVDSSKKDDDMTKKKSDREFVDKELRKVAGLLNKKMNKSSINRLVNILEKD